MLKLGAAFAALCIWAGAVWAQADAIGYVKTVQGGASVSVGGRAQPAQPGTPLYVGAVLRTDKDGSLGVTFKDNTIMSLGPDTEITVDEYLFSPGSGELKLGANMLRGTLNYISGLIAKLKPEAVSLKTPKGIIGVRGTHFLAKVEE
jgi:hypothetical protein